MSYKAAGALKKSSNSKSLPIKNISCFVCLCNRSSSLFSTNYCSSSLTKHVKRRVCDTCVHQHILSKLYSCLTSSITCPEVNCTVALSQKAICEILSKYKSHQLLNNYLREQQWQGKSDEWIKRFAARCPGCNVPIEKNGGCDEMVCIRCQTHFYWSKAKRYVQTDRKHQNQSFFVIDPLVDGIILVIFLLLLILSTVIYFNK